MVGQSISHYRIREKIGEGGMGEVYLAEDARLARRVAIKFLPSSLQYDPDRRARFLKEARAASALRSPYIATVYDMGEHEGAMYIVMEYIDGEALSRRIERGAVPLVEAIEWGLQITDALDEAHTLGIIHRDIKSANLMVTGRGLVKVLDFGLARFTDAYAAGGDDRDNTLVFGKDTKPGVVFGTVSYMSPEQARGISVDARTDIFSLGVVIYEMVTSRRPFEGATASDLIVAILEKDPLPLARTAEHLPAQLEWIVTKALRKNRDERYQTIKDLGVDLKNLKQSIELEAALVRTALLDSSSGPRAASDSGETSGIGEGNRRRRSRKVIDSIAVLPLANAAADAGAEYLTDGITEGIINSLSRLPKLRVMARSTVFRYKGQQVDAQAVGRELGVKAVMTGRVFQVGQRLVIGTELVNVEDGTQLWGEQYNQTLSDIFELQERISKEISEKLRLKLGAKDKKRLAKRHTENTEAYELYLIGRYHWNKWTEAGFRESIGFFEKALEKDPKFALAYSGLSDAYGTLWYFNYLPTAEAIPKSKRAALEALSLDNTLAEAHVSLANAYFYYEWDWASGERWYKRAIELNPSYATAAQLYSHYLLAMGRFDEAIAQMKKARELDPMSLIINSGLGLVYYFSGRYDEAIKQSRKTLEFDAEFPFAHEVIGASFEAQGLFDEAASEYLKMIPQMGRVEDMLPSLREAYEQGGLEGFWRKFLSFPAALLNSKYVSPFSMAVKNALIGEKDRAFDWLERAYEDRVGFLVMIKIEPRLEGLRSDPRYNDLLRRMRLE
ncbi:MAG TPA: protein kinase [Blastocatellia bacterium]